MVTQSMTTGAGTAITAVLGRAAEDLPGGTVLLKVILPEITPGIEGPFSAATTEASVKTLTPDGREEEGQLTLSNHITATWIGERNVTYPPRVVKNEQVEVIKVGDSDKYYWKALGRDKENEKLDILRFSVSDTQSLSEPKTDDNTYFFEMDTVNKRVSLRTSMSDGEPVKYSMVFDTSKGTFTLADSLKNVIAIDSQKPDIHIANFEQTIVRLIQKNLFLGAPEDTIIKADRQLVLKTPVVTMDAASGDAVMKLQAGSINLETSNGVCLSGPTIGLNGATKVYGPLVSGPHRAEGYGTGSVGGGYSGSQTNIVSGSGTTAANSPDDASPNSANRHAVAHEEFMQVCQIIVDCFDAIEVAIGAPGGLQQDIIPPALRAKMAKLRGE